MLQKVFQFFWINTEPHQEVPPLDPTVYRIETLARTYCGQIIFQDDMQMKLKLVNHRPVKVLKHNIKCVSIMRE
jgi:hypothetical protein